MRAVTVFVVSLIIMALPATGKADTPADGVVSGRVILEGSSAPVKNAAVSLAAALMLMETETAADGSFLLDGVPNGRGMSLFVSASGYRPATAKVTVSGTDTSYVTITLPRAHLHLISPNGGEYLIAGTEVPVIWESWGVETIAIDVSYNAGRNWRPLATGIRAEAGRWIWDVDDIPTPEGLLRIRSLNKNGIADTTDGLFRTTSI